MPTISKQCVHFFIKPLRAPTRPHIPQRFSEAITASAVPGTRYLGTSGLWCSLCHATELRIHARRERCCATSTVQKWAEGSPTQLRIVVLDIGYRMDFLYIYIELSNFRYIVSSVVSLYSLAAPSVFFIVDTKRKFPYINYRDRIDRFLNLFSDIQRYAQHPPGASCGLDYVIMLTPQQFSSKGEKLVADLAKVNSGSRIHGTKTITGDRFFCFAPKCGRTGVPL